MKVNISPRFKRAYKRTPRSIQGDFNKKITLFMDNPRNPHLKTHKLKGRLQSCLSFYLCDGYRVLFEFSAKNIVDLLDIGSHDKYRRWRK